MQTYILCKTLRQYENITASLRSEADGQLFVALKRSHNPVTSCTITQWLKETLRLAGVDISIFSAHS